MCVSWHALRIKCFYAALCCIYLLAALLSRRGSQAFPLTLCTSMKHVLTVTHMHISGYSPVGAGERRMPVDKDKKYSTLGYGKHSHVKCRFSVLH